MSNYTDAAEAIDRELVRMDGLQHASAALKELGSLEQALVDARRLTECARAELGQIQEETQQARDAGVRAMDEATQAATQAIHEGRTKADRLVAEATTTAATLVADATIQAREIRDREIDGRQAALKALARDIQTAESRLRELTAQQAQAEADTQAANELRIEAQCGLDTVQEQIARLSGRSPKKPVDTSSTITEA